MKKSSMIVALDLGTTKTTVLVGDIDEAGELNIIGFGEAETQGVEKGIIVKPGDVIPVIRKAVAEAQTSSGVSISSVIANISNIHVECQNVSDFLTFGTNQKEIDDADIALLQQKIEEKINKDQYEVLHIIPKKFILDDIDEVIDPKGLIASKLRGVFHVVLVKKNILINLNRVIEASGLKVIDYVYNPIASSFSTLYPEEKDMGILLIDIGGGTTDIAVLKDGTFEFTKTIPFGGKNVTSDISRRFKIPFQTAEELKKQYGMALKEALRRDEIIEIEPFGSNSILQISLAELVETIHYRLEEILEMVRDEVSNAGYLDKINGGIVLTGGVANTPYIKELAQFVFPSYADRYIDVRIGKPKDYIGFADRIDKPDYATSIGMMIFKRDSVISSKSSFTANKENDILNIFKNIIGKIKELF